MDHMIKANHSMLSWKKNSLSIYCDLGLLFCHKIQLMEEKKMKWNVTFWLFHDHKKKFLWFLSNASSKMWTRNWNVNFRIDHNRWKEILGGPIFWQSKIWIPMRKIQVISAQMWQQKIIQILELNDGCNNGVVTGIRKCPFKHGRVGHWIEHTRKTTILSELMHKPHSIINIEIQTLLNGWMKIP